MKKSIKLVGALSVIVLMLVVLTGCRGNNNTLVAVMEHNEHGVSITETLEITFDGDTIEEIVSNLEFETEEEAIEYYEIVSMFLDSENISRSGRTVSVTYDLDEMLGENAADMTREEIEEMLEEEGYTIR